MEIKQLEYFAAAVEYGSLNRAAGNICWKERMFMHQEKEKRIFKMS